MKRATTTTCRGLPPVRLVEMHRLATALVAGLILVTASCGQMVGSGAGDGSVAITLGELTATSVYGDQNLQPTSYVFSGSGPDGATFSLISEAESTTVEGLKSGEWHISVEGLNDQDTVVLAGETVIEVQPFAETKIELALAPVSGVGALLVTAEWNGDHTIEPSSRVTITDSAGDSNTWMLSADSGRAERTIEDLPTGVYRVAIQLFDGGEQIGGSAHTVRVVNGSATEVLVEFEALNKVGKPMEIADETFTLGWDEPEGGAPDQYRVYARERGEYHWALVDEIAANNSPQYTVSPEILTYGTYEFAVSSVAGGQESALHSSMADSALPATGWYVEWVGP